MGFFYGPPSPPPEEEPRGCRDVFALTRAAFAILIVPIGILVGAILAIVGLLYLFGRSWVLGVLALIVVVVGVLFYARWERRHFRGL